MHTGWQGGREVRMQVGMHTDWQGGRLGIGGDAYRLAGREVRMQVGMHTDWQGGRLGCRQGCILVGREGG